MGVAGDPAASSSKSLIQILKEKRGVGNVWNKSGTDAVVINGAWFGLLGN